MKMINGMSMKMNYITSGATIENTVALLGDVC